jgi:Fe-S oxidoreductase
MVEPLDAVAKPATLCAFCPKMCRFACPVAEAEARETVTPWSKMSLVYLARQGSVDLDSPGAANALEACTGCGACVEQCAHGNPVAETLFVARGVAGTERSTRFRKNFEETGDVKRRDLRPALDALESDANARIAYFPGCTRLAGDASAMERDLEALAIAAEGPVKATELPPGVTCCGYPLYADGQLDALADHFERMKEALKGHEVVVTPDPGCAHTLTVARRAVLGDDDDWPAVLPLVELLAERAEQFAGRSDGLRVRVHDPCYLGRRGRSFEAPRTLLQSATGLAPGEFAMAREEADCSGGGGLYPTSNPDGALRAARRRLEEDGNAHQPVDAVVTACPSAARSLRRTGARVLDVVDVALGRIDE